MLSRQIFIYQEGEFYTMTKSEIIAKVNELIATPNCNPELRAAAENYIKAQDKAAAEKLIKALESCVNSIDETLAFAESDMGKNIFGEETAKNIAQNCHKAKDAGEKFCTCPACQLGAVIYANKEAL